MALPDIPIWLPFLLLLFFLVYSLIGSRKISGMPGEIFGIGAVFAGVIIGFILVIALQKFEATQSDRSIFYQLIDRLRKRGPEEAKVAEVLIYNYKRRIHVDNDLSQLYGDLGRQLQEALTNHIAQVNHIAPLIWYSVFVVIIIITILIIIDARLTSFFSICIILIIWLPLIAIYSLYITR